MKKTVFVLVWSILLSSFAGTVEWNKAFVMSWEDYSGVHDQSVTIGAPSFLPTWGDRIEGGWRLTAIPGSYMEYANTFVLSCLGDLVYADYINNQSLRATHKGGCGINQAPNSLLFLKVHNIMTA